MDDLATRIKRLRGQIYALNQLLDDAVADRSAHLDDMKTKVFNWNRRFAIFRAKLDQVYAIAFPNGSKGTSL